MTIEQLVVTVALHVIQDQADDARHARDGADEMQHVADDRHRSVVFDARSFDAHGAHGPPVVPQDERAMQLACQCARAPKNGADAGIPGRSAAAAH